MASQYFWIYIIYFIFVLQNIVENISQVLFNKTKVLDRLRYQRREMENTLIALKVYWKNHNGYDN